MREFQICFYDKEGFDLIRYPFVKATSVEEVCNQVVAGITEVEGLDLNCLDKVDIIDIEKYDNGEEDSFISLIYPGDFNVQEFTVDNLLDEIICRLEDSDVAFTCGSDEEWLEHKDFMLYCESGKEPVDFVFERIPEMRNAGANVSVSDDEGFVYARSAECINTTFTYYKYNGVKFALIN